MTQENKNPAIEDTALSVQRYDAPHEGEHGMERADDGCWVDYDDWLPVAAKVKAQEAELNKLAAENAKLKQDKLNLLAAIDGFANRRDMGYYCIPLRDEMKEFVEKELNEIK